MISAKNISKSINGNLILNDITLCLKKGEINVLFGPSGCGKTTLCRSLALLDYPDKGTLEIFEKIYSFPAKKKFKNLPYPKINFVYQQLFLWPHLTNRQNILLATNNGDGSYGQELKFYSGFFGISEILEQYPNESSIGQRQRVAITRALVLKPEFLFLDEITSALDVVQTKKIIELTAILKKQGVGILIITHNLSVIEKIAEHVFFMNEGEIIENGSKNILANPQSKILRRFLNG